jgi:hypothetical protein
MKRIDIDEAIRQHNKWRRQFLNAFAGGSYADMPLSEHRCCTLGRKLTACANEQPNAHPLADSLRAVILVHDRFHDLANEIVDLSQNGLGDSADLLLPELNEGAHLLVAALDGLREQLAD